MGQLKNKGQKFILCFIAGLVTGILIGTAILSIIVSYRMDMHYKKIAYLETTIQDKNARLEKLEKSINTQNIILKDIEIILIFDGDEMDEIDEIEIEKAIKEKYSTLLGKEVKNIDPDILIEVADKRILKIEDREYRLHINKLILTEILKIFIKVEI
ncbi:hypothetical protein KQI88_07875 [Alkaliphilus sp. MSJ-5]|uniref:Sporulation membrane protein YtrI C-terminal domain-containing protein n=1 Tax=Alkaliphilus flagellatus TaxID=2841507 RepID=A0ABS6G1H0_9FIRM|nr:hypothetical protein [Alkaliphilus flagellatus]MBU5676332.1 hypothetical protein [Alkaliphilus flagellatus]